MRQQSARQQSTQKVTYLICFVVISITVTGYFVGLQSPMNPAAQAIVGGVPPEATEAAKGSAILATHYSEMQAATALRSEMWRTSLTDLKSTFDPMAEVTISPEQKALALTLREQNRAFNGAPPTIPHPVDQMSALACMACHGDGVKTETLRISKMSHQFLTNCTQCHVENDSRLMTATEFRENSFVGLPAPSGGPRAYEGAPPMIPHSTWMRVNCTSCHGFAGQHGIRTTHPWRTNCQQCHAPSSRLDQIQIDATPKFLSPPTITER